MTEVNSRFVVGEIFHQRCRPVVDRFVYPMYYCLFDLDELPQLASRVSKFSCNGFNWISLYDKDYLPGRQGSIKDKLLAYIRESGIEKEISRIELLTSARVLLPVFNPVSFYCCYDGNDSLACAVAEVNNTFGETHLYILEDKLSGGTAHFNRYDSPKEFHVSPFNDINGVYRFYFSKKRISQGVEKLDFRVNILRDGTAVYMSQIRGTTLQFDNENLKSVLLKYPLGPHITYPRILWEAAKLRYSKKLKVYTKPIASSPMTIRSADPSRLQQLCWGLGKRFLSNTERGCLVLRFPDGTEEVFGDKHSALSGTMFIKNYDFFGRSLIHGDIGFGESYCDGQWDADDLTEVLKIFLENIDSMDDRSIILSKIGRFFNRLLHIGRSNTRRGSKKNIGAHYDLSNELFGSFLDPTMTYSCGIYESESDDLETAQRNKLDAIISKARICESDHVLEIGCGWGSFAIRAAQQTGCRVTGITLSAQQKSFAEKRIAEAGLQDRVKIELRDYRSMEGSFDKIVSIEMLEAVGHRYLGTFFKTCESLLRPDGLCVLQVISFPDQRYDVYRQGCDWIQKYVFPGGICPSLTAICQALTRSSKFIVEDVENIGIHYARTLKEWRDHFRESFSRDKARFREHGFDEHFERMWHYYLCYCEAGFATRNLGTLQMVLTRTNNKNLNQVPQVIKHYRTGNL